MAEALRPQALELKARGFNQAETARALEVSPTTICIALDPTKASRYRATKQGAIAAGHYGRCWKCNRGIRAQTTSICQACRFAANRKRDQRVADLRASGATYRQIGQAIDGLSRNAIATALRRHQSRTRQ